MAIDIHALADRAEAHFYARMPGGFVVRSTFHRYLERRPYDNAWTWLAPDTRYATHFVSLAQARDVVASLPADMLVQVAVIIEIGDNRREPVFHTPIAETAHADAGRAASPAGDSHEDH